MDFPAYLYPQPVPCDVSDRAGYTCQTDGDVFDRMGDVGGANITEEGAVQSQYRYPRAGSQHFKAASPTVPLTSPADIAYPYRDPCTHAKTKGKLALHKCVRQMKLLHGMAQRQTGLNFQLSHLHLGVQGELSSSSPREARERDACGWRERLLNKPGYSCVDNLLQASSAELFSDHRHLRRVNRDFAGGCLTVLNDMGPGCYACHCNGHEREGRTLLLYGSGRSLRRVQLATVELPRAELSEGAAPHTHWGRKWDATVHQVAACRYDDGLLGLVRTSRSVDVVRLPPGTECDSCSGDDPSCADAGMRSVREGYLNSSVDRKGTDEAVVATYRCGDRSRGSQTSVAYSVLNSYCEGEAALVNESAVTVWSYGEHFPVREVFKFQDPEEFEKYPDTPYRQVFYGSQPKHLLAATSTNLRLLDMRAANRQPLVVFCEPSSLAGLNARLTAATPLQSNRHQTALFTNRSALLVDDRFPKHCMLSWPTPALSSILYANSYLLSGDLRSLNTDRSEIVLCAAQESAEVFCAPVVAARHAEPPVMADRAWRACPFRDFTQLCSADSVQGRLAEERASASLVGVGIASSFDEEPSRQGRPDQFTLVHLSAYGDLYGQTYKLGHRGDGDKSQCFGPEESAGRTNTLDHKDSRKATAAIGRSWSNQLASQVSRGKPATELAETALTAPPRAHLTCALCNGAVHTSTQQDALSLDTHHGAQGEPVEIGRSEACARCGCSMKDGARLSDAVSADRILLQECRQDPLAAISSLPGVKVAMQSTNGKPTEIELESLLGGQTERGAVRGTSRCSKADREINEAAIESAIIGAEGKVLQKLWLKEDITDALSRRDKLWRASKDLPKVELTLSDLEQESARKRRRTKSKPPKTSSSIPSTPKSKGKEKDHRNVREGKRSGLSPKKARKNKEF